MNEADPAIERFEALLQDSRIATGGLVFRELAAEFVAVLSLLAELPATERASGSLESFAFRECFTALTLLGRRLALLDLTPTSTLQLVELALRATGGREWRSTGSFEQRAVAAAIEGFVMGREERVTQAAEARAAKTLKPLRLDDDVFALFVTGMHDATVLSECVDALGRMMLDAGAETAIVDFTQLGEPNRERAAAMFAADEVARMLGAVCFFTGLDWQWKAAALEAHVPLEALHVVPTVAEALSVARKSTRPRRGGSSRWASFLRRLGR
ncbi:MAG: hypothetical protein WAU39_10310 [Polyangiales bacterium]